MTAAASKTVWLITGASRGVGLELTRQLSQQGSTTVLATARNPDSSSKLQEIKSKAANQVHIVKLDTSSEDSIKSASKEVESLLGGKGIDYLINNAAIQTGGDDRSFSFITQNMSDDFQTNVIGPAIMGREFVDQVAKSEKKTVVNITSGLASFGRDLGPINLSYSISKTAINMLTYKQAKEMKDMTFICLDPGWIVTDMGGPNAPLTVENAVKNIISTISSSTPSMSGSFVNNEGKVVPW